MSDDTDFRLAEIERRLANVVRVGTIGAADYEAARVRVQLDGLLTAPLPWTAHRAGGDRSWWAPETGEQVVVVSPGGDLRQGVVFPALYADAAPAPANDPNVTRRVWGDGLVVEHDRAAKVTRVNALDSAGTLILEAKNVVIRTGPEGYFQLDHHGLATRITHLGGADFKTESWQTGATVTPEEDAGYSPPEVPSPEE